MKLITFFIILITLLNYSNQDDPPPMRSYTYEFEKYDSFEFNEIKGVQIVLHLNKFDKGENFFIILNLLKMMLPMMKVII